jgi:hypothetical protein
MNLRRIPIALIISLGLALVGVGVFLSVRLQRSEAGGSVPPAVEVVRPTPRPLERVDEFPTQNTVVERRAPAPAPSPTSLRPLPTPVAPEIMVRRYDEIRVLGDTNKEILRKQIDADPELSEVLKAKLRLLESPLFYITLAQALNDPVLRPAVVEKLEENTSYYLVKGINETAEKFGLGKPNTYTPKTGEQIASLLRSLEPHLQAEYERLLEKMQISEEMAEALVHVRASEVIYNQVYDYMVKRGWRSTGPDRKFEQRGANSAGSR